MLCVEFAHSNPVMIVFIHNLQSIVMNNNMSKQDVRSYDSKTPLDGASDVKQHLLLENGEKQSGRQQVRHGMGTRAVQMVLQPTSSRARQRWFLALTLTNNPGLMLSRKQKLQKKNALPFSDSFANLHKIA
jgi:hypothetical protein